MKWNEVKWSEMKWNEMKWNEMKWSAMKWNEVQWSEKKWNEVKWSEMNVLVGCQFWMFLNYRPLQNLVGFASAFGSARKSYKVLLGGVLKKILNKMYLDIYDRIL